jgi:hypothetical protein
VVRFEWNQRLIRVEIRRRRRFKWVEMEARKAGKNFAGGQTLRFREVVTMNELECDVEEMRNFVSVSSPFYPHLATHYDQCFVEWADECE